MHNKVPSLRVGANQDLSGIIEAAFGFNHYKNGTNAETISGYPAEGFAKLRAALADGRLAMTACSFRTISPGARGATGPRIPTRRCVPLRCVALDVGTALPASEPGERWAQTAHIIVGLLTILVGRPGPSVEADHDD